MTKKNIPANEGPQEAGSLLLIRGIGQTTASILNQLGIANLYDLAGYSPEELIELVRDHLPPLTLQRIIRDDWIGQARALAAESGQEPHSPAAPANQVDNPVGEALDYLASGGPLAQDPNMLPDSGWQEVADFFVSLGYTRDQAGRRRLRTRAHHSQADQTQEWDGLALTELIQWMLDRAGLKETPDQPGASLRPGVGAQMGDGNGYTTSGEQRTRKQEQKPSPSSPQTWEEPPVELELSDLWVSEPVETGQTNRLRIACVLVLGGPKAEQITFELSPYNLEVYLVNSQTNLSNLAAQQTGQLEGGQLSYPIQQDFDIPPEGNYQIYILARLQRPNAPATHVQGPILQVEN
jgi:hypothetical protein